MLLVSAKLAGTGRLPTSSRSAATVLVARSDDSVESSGPTGVDGGLRPDRRHRTVGLTPFPFISESFMHAAAILYGCCIFEIMSRISLLFYCCARVQVGMEVEFRKRASVTRLAH